VFPPGDSAAFGTAESILIDGANSVSDEPRRQFPHATASLLLGALALALTVTLLRKRSKAVLAALTLTALPGLAWVLVLRADAPAKRGSVAADIASTLEDLRAHAPWPGTPVRIVREDDDVLFPLGRYAMPSRPASPHPSPEVQLELRGDRLGEPCRTDAASGHVICGAGE
jgi:hypothetical protein